MQGALRVYLSSFVDLSGIPLNAKGNNWVERYKDHFLNVCGIDWNPSPVPLSELEEINLARNDLEHGGEPFGMTRRQSKEHVRRFPAGLFVEEMDKQLFQRPGESWPLRIMVTDDGLKEAIRRVECFCEFLDSQRT